MLRSWELGTAPWWFHVGFIEIHRVLQGYLRQNDKETQQRLNRMIPRISQVLTISVGWNHQMVIWLRPLAALSAS